MSQTIPDEELRQILTNSQTIALVGASAKPARPSHQVMAYLQRAGYKVLPVNPGLAGQKLLGETVYGDLTQIDQPVDLVDIFRRADAVPDIVEQAIALKAQTIWMQLGIVHEKAAQRARDAGLNVVMNRCTKIEHARLIG